MSTSADIEEEEDDVEFVSVSRVQYVTEGEIHRFSIVRFLGCKQSHSEWVCYELVDCRNSDFLTVVVGGRGLHVYNIHTYSHCI